MNLVSGSRLFEEVGVPNFDDTIWKAPPGAVCFGMFADARFPSWLWRGRILVLEHGQAVSNQCLNLSKGRNKCLSVHFLPPLFSSSAWGLSSTKGYF